MREWLWLALKTVLTVPVAKAAPFDYFRAANSLLHSKKRTSYELNKNNCERLTCEIYIKNMYIKRILKTPTQNITNEYKLLYFMNSILWTRMTTKLKLLHDYHLDSTDMQTGIRK